jgi:hypothetical protein
VLDRGLTLLGFLEERWEEELGSREEKVALLGLDFLEGQAGEEGDAAT